MEFGRDYEHHFRLDLERFDNNRYQQMATSGGSNAPYIYRVSSVHIKGEVSYQNRRYAYLYLNYCGGGVWQPIWGYLKEYRGRVVRKLELTSKEVGQAMSDCKWFMGILSDVMRTPHGVAAGPLQGAGGTVDSVRLQGLEW